MRIVAGNLRGRTIEAPRGEGTRPTVDRVREALFSSLYSLRGAFDDAVVLDAFAGSGALGIEALSRGAHRAVFFESDKAAAAVLERNLRACGLGADAAQVVRRDVLVRKPVAQNPPFDLVFLDPPYAYDAEEVLSMVHSLSDVGSLAPDAIIVYEHAIAARDELAEVAAGVGFAVCASKKYGKTGITILKELR